MYLCHETDAARWRIALVYGVYTKLVELLMYLHIGTRAAVRRGGIVADWPDVHCGVQQGFVLRLLP
jgi:hypothetical protein